MVRKKNTGANPLMALERYIRIKVDTSDADKDIKKLSASLNTVDKNAKGAARSINTMGKSAGSATTKLKGLNTQADKTKKSYDGLNGTMGKFNLSITAAAVSAGIVAVQLARAADSYTLMERQIARSEKTQDGFNARFKELITLANDVGADLQSTISLYARLEFATSNLNLGQAKTLQITETLTKAFKSTGLSSSETASAVLQLSQAFASGRLQGDEFRSVSENAPIILKALAKELNVTTGELKAMSSQGLITSEVLASAVLNSSQDINQEFNRITKNTKTLGEGWAVLSNGAVALTGAIDSLAGATNSLSGSMASLGERLTGISETLRDGEFSASYLYLLSGALNSLGGAAGETASILIDDYTKGVLAAAEANRQLKESTPDEIFEGQDRPQQSDIIEGDYARFSEKPEQARTQEQTESDYAEFAAQKRIEIEEKQNRELLQLSQGFYSQQLDIATSGFEAYTGIEQDAHTQMLQMSQAFYDQELDQLFESFQEKNAVAEVGWQDYANIASSAIQSIGTISANSVQSDINAIEQSRDARLSLAKTEEERVQISLDAEKKINAYRKKAFEDKKKADIVSAGINTALAVTKALADTANPYYAAAIGALGAVQISAIESSRFGGSTSSASPSAVPNQTNSASDTNRVVTTENLALTQIANELSNFDNDEPLPASLTKRIIIALDNQSTLGG